MKKGYLVLFVVGLLLVSGQAAFANLILNPGFETGDFTSWTRSGNLGFTGVTTGGFYVHDGSYGSNWGPVGSLGYISQTVATVAGSYDISLWYHSSGDWRNELYVNWDGNVLLNQFNIPGAGWTQYSFTEPALTGFTTLTIGLRNDPSYDGLDDISVTRAVPEPSSLLLLGAGLAALAFCFRKH